MLRALIPRLALVVVYALFIVGVFSVASKEGTEETPSSIIWLLIATCAIAGTLICVLLSKWDYASKYVSEFKSKVIERIVHFIDENLSYNPHGHISQSMFTSSKIFLTKPNKYQSDDLVTGKLGATKITFSEIHAEHKNDNTVCIFKGLFFIGDFNKHFTSETVVLPDTAEKLFGRFGQKLQSMNIFRDKLIKFDDPEFERQFVVYGDDQIQARDILSTSLMERIVEFRKKTSRKIYLSFVGSKVFVAVSYTKSLFEPRLFEILLDFDPDFPNTS